MLIDTRQLSQPDIYRILIGAVAPRPIAWVGSRSSSGINNLAPFSFYNIFSAKPPIAGFSTIPHADGRKKDTLQNVEESGCFTLNSVSHALVKQMSRSSALLEPEQDEFIYAGVTAEEANLINAPLVKEALLVFECKLHDIIRFGNEPGAGNLVLGEIIQIHVEDRLYQNGRIDFEQLDPVGRLAGNWYSTIRDKFELERG